MSSVNEEQLELREPESESHPALVDAPSAPLPQADKRGEGQDEGQTEGHGVTSGYGHSALILSLIHI